LIARRVAFAALRATLLPFLFREIQRRKVTIIVYHAPQPEVFDEHLAVLERLYNIIPLSTYVAAREAGATSALPPKALIVTIDDGHRSNYLLGAVIAKHHVPVTIFLCSGVIGTKRRFWFLHLPTAANVQHLKTVSDVERNRVLRGIGFENAREFDERQALSEAEIEELKPAVDFQSHTVFHPILTQCQIESAAAEIVDSKHDLEARLSDDVYALAYPNGSYSEREAALAARAGYRCALTLDRGLNSDDTPLFKLRRIALPDDADRHELIVKTSGLWGAIRSISAAKRGIIFARNWRAMFASVRHQL